MRKGDSYKDHYTREPLCMFCLSPPFFIRGFSGEKHHSAPSSRRQKLFFINRKKLNGNLLVTIADLFKNFKRRKSLKLEEILSTVQEAWKGPKTVTSSNSKLDMEMVFNKTLVMGETSPMNHRRRRLSVPEIIMRKHTLAQEHCGSQESKYYYWSNDTQCLSDPNLNRKKDFNLIRKSTLLRRLWGDSNKPKILSGSFQEWQYSYKNGSSIKSLNSNHSSPEHLPKYMRDTTSPRRKPSTSPNKFSGKKNGDYESTTNSPQRKMTIIDNTSLKADTKPPFSRESTTKYTYSSFTNFSDSNSDSAYTNSISNFTNAVNSSSKNSENQNRSEPESRLSRISFQETAVQTKDVANLNVISNVNLSQSTLDLIFKEVMKDVSKLTPGEIQISSAMVTCDDQSDIMVNKIPCDNRVKTTPHSDCTVLSSNRANREQFIISNVRTGSPYIKPTENVETAIPRFSAIPRTSSMEVNTSEEDKDESDTTSFVDSLEDSSSPRVLTEGCRSSSDISQLLPEGKKYFSPNKSSTFYIPIEIASDKEVKAVSEFLPVKVRERLVERQQKREEKCRQFKSISTLKISESVSEIKSNLGRKKYMPKKRTKPVLPSIELFKKSPNDKNYPLKSSFTGRKSSRLSKGMDNAINKSENFKSEPRKMYRRTNHENTEKRIEILDIMECIEVPPEKGQKSKIPIPINNTSNKKGNFDKPSYLDLGNYVSDQNVDQLIANILIDSLNHDVNTCNYESDKKNANFSEPVISASDDISDETSSRRRNPEEKKNNNNNNGILRQPNESYTRSVINKKFEKKNVSSIPKGWVTLYTVHKDTETPESTSDEGKQYLDTNDVKEVTRPFANVDVATEKNNSAKSNLTISDSKPEYKNDYILLSNNDENTIFDSTLLDRPVRKFGKYLRKSKMNSLEQQQNTTEDWSVTVSGTNSFGQMVPDVEMRLKFPNKFIPFNQNYCKSSIEEKNTRGKRCNFPKIGHDRSCLEKQKKVQKQRSIDDCLPKIQTTHNGNKKTDGSVISMGPSGLIPRQTKTSRSRYNFSRPRDGFSMPGVPSILNERQYYEILRRIPDILAVTGRSLSSEGKSF